MASFFSYFNGSSSSQQPASTSTPPVSSPSNAQHGIAMYSVILYRWNASNPIQLATCFHLSTFPFLYRQSIKEHIVFNSRLIASRTALGGREVVEFEEKMGRCHSYAHTSGICATAVTSIDYPMRVAFACVSEIIRVYIESHSELDWKNCITDKPESEVFRAGNELLNTYQNPVEADKILKVQKDLNEVKDVMLKNIDQILKRGEKLDELMQKSADISSSSYQFYRQAKRNNQCCKMY